MDSVRQNECVFNVPMETGSWLRVSSDWLGDSQGWESQPMEKAETPNTSQGSHEILWPAFVTDFHDFKKSTFLHMFLSFLDYL